MNRRESFISAIAGLLGFQTLGHAQEAAARKSAKRQHGPTTFCLSEPDFEALRTAVLASRLPVWLPKGCVEGQRAIAIDREAATNVLFALAQGVNLRDEPDPRKTKRPLR